VPHSPQNFRPGSFSVPQLAQVVTMRTLEPVRALRKRRYAPRVSPEQRLWWRRLLLVFAQPRPVFAALRSTDEEDEAARQEPVLLVVLLAGMASVLFSAAWREVLDQPAVDGLAAVVLTFVAGGTQGAAAYLLVGGAIHLGSRGMGNPARFRTTRHVLAFAAAPFGLSLLVIVPAALIAYGDDWFRSGGADEGAGGDVLLAGGFVFAAWSAGLLVLGLRETLGLPWAGVAGTLLLGGVLLAGLAVLPSVL
jgi:hypothetical protein